MNRSVVFAAVVSALGFCAMGFFIGDGVRHIKSTDRYVNVRGLSERDVLSDTAQLAISIGHNGANPAAIFPAMSDTQKLVLDYLKQYGLKDDEIETGQWMANHASSEDIKNDPATPRYTVNGTITVTTHNMNAAADAYKNINDLRIKTNGGVTYADIDYSFNGLNAIRTEMIASATKEARNGAMQFATDSGSRLGSIRNATQGNFEINSPQGGGDERKSLHKTVRVVTTVDYELKD